MNDRYRMREKLWAIGVGRGYWTPQEAFALEALWNAEERSHRHRELNLQVARA